MGIIKATMNAIGGGLADQWLEVLEADDMGGTTLFTKGVKVRKTISVITTRREPRITYPTARSSTSTPTSS